MSEGWTPERVSDLKRLWQQGFSASDITQMLKGTTRNAVIGKIDRLRRRGVILRKKPA